MEMWKQGGVREGVPGRGASRAKAGSQDSTEQAEEGVRGPNLPVVCLDKLSFSGSPPHATVYTSSTGTGSGAMATDTAWPAEPKIVTIWPTAENVCLPLI